MTKQIELRQITNYIYATPHRLSTAVFLAVHSCLATSQLLIGNNYLEAKIQQFQEHPLATTFEVLVPYLVTYVSNSIGRRLR
jgi:hypothetical protein